MKQSTSSVLQLAPSRVRQLSLRHPGANARAALTALLFASWSSACSGGPEAAEVLEPIGSDLNCTAAVCSCNSYFSIGFVQNVDGVRGNFEIVAPAAAGGLVHYNREDDGLAQGGFDLAWSSPTPFASGDVNGVSLIQSSFTTNGKHHLEATYVVGDKLYTVWRNDGAGYVWSSPNQIATGVRGTPALIQSKAGSVGNFELVVPLAVGGIAHYFRDNDSGAGWVKTGVFGSGLYDAVALTQSNYDEVGSDGGNLEVVARQGSKLYHFFRDPSQWSPGQLIASGVTGSPALMQGTSGNIGNFEVITPLAAGGMAHYYRDNDASNEPWLGPYSIPDMSSGSVSAVSIIESNYGVGTIEWVARKDGELYWGSRTGTTLEWSGAYSFSAQPCCDARSVGRWSDEIPGEITGIHAALQPNGKVLYFGFKDDSPNDDGMIGASRLFNPTNNSITTPSWDHQSSLPAPTKFCSGHSALASGDLLVAGGDMDDQTSYHVFDHASGSWGPRRSLGGQSAGRWYPTTATLANGSVFMISGSTSGPLHDWDAKTEDTSLVNNTWQIANQPAQLSAAVNVATSSSFKFSPARDASDSGVDSPAFAPIDLYPFVYLLPSGSLFVHSRTTSRILSNPAANTTSIWSAPFHTNSRVPRTYPRQGTSVLLPLLPAQNYRPKVLVIGGGGAKWPTATQAATSSVEQTDLGAASPSWSNVASMNYPRILHDAVLLPNGKVFVVGGSARGRSDDGIAPVLTPEIYDPATNTWTKLCPMRVPRGYHSTALLLPSGKVAVAGKDGIFQEPPYKYPEHRIELYSPSYLYSSDPRPVIDTITRTSSEWNKPWTVALKPGVSSSQITSAVLIRLGSTTHGVNMDQRSVGLTITGRPNSSQLTVLSPPNANIAPPGYYMLFVLAAGVPSEAKIVRLHQDP